MTQQRCGECGFDTGDWNREDALNTLRLAPQLIELWATGLGPGERPPARNPFDPNGPHGASAAEYDAAAIAAVHQLWHRLGDLYRLATAQVGPPPAQQGSVQQINVSGGGVPKQPVPTVEVGWRGLVGDTQRARRHHGRPWQALCLWSGDVIEALVAEGHPVHPGAAGENLTVRGIDWGELRAGSTLELGAVRGRLSAPAVPCAKNNQWFVDGDSRRIDHDLHPGWSRWYASVLEPGLIATGDGVSVLPI